MICQDDLVRRHDRLGVVALHPTLARLPDLAVRIAGIGHRVRIDRWLGRLGLAAPLALAGGLLLGRPRRDLLLPAGRSLGGAALQLLLTRFQPGQPVAAPGQILGQCITALSPELAILLGVRRFRVCQHPGDLLLDAAGGTVGVERSVRLHLGPIQRHQPEPNQSSVPAQLQNVEEHHLHPLRMPAAEARDDGVIRNVFADNEPIARVAAAQPFNHPARPHTVAVGVDQQRQENPRRKRRLARPANLAARLETLEVHQRHRVHDQMHDVRRRQPVHHVDRQQEALAAIRCPEEMRHLHPPAVADPQAIIPLGQRQAQQDEPHTTSATLRSNCATGSIQTA